MPNKLLTQRPAWKALLKHQSDLKDTHIRDLFAENESRFDQLHQELDGLLYDYSKNLITSETIDLLVALAHECELEQWRDKMFSCKKINTTEDRAALHTALRTPAGETDDLPEEIANYIDINKRKIQELAEQIRSDGKFTDVVNIGIGGSDLGPNTVCEALKGYADGPNVHFVSNVDGAHISQILKKLSPETTLFIIASKTFTTLETVTNAETARNWLVVNERNSEDHFIAITSNKEAAKEFGVHADNILELREWIGGRYSLWSAIGLSIAISVGFENFEKLLAGAYAMDNHFKSAPLDQNIPVIMALLGIWHRNFMNHEALAILPYAKDLHKFPAYIQQLDMESNGKNVDRNGNTINYTTSPVVFGDVGTNNQHAFFQLLHQGTNIIPADFVIIGKTYHGLDDHHTKLLANALAQSQALMQGNGLGNEPHRKFEGNRPNSTLILDRLDPYHLGMLLALYEHKIFVQGIIWNINSFDQWGVELGKNLTENIIEIFEKDSKNRSLDPSTQSLIHHLQKCS